VDGEGVPVELDGGDVFAWSPSGHQLAYVRDGVRAGVEGSEIAVAGFDGTDDRVMASDPRFVRGLAWSPDGTQVLYVADAGTVSGQLMVVPAAGVATPVALTQPRHSFEYTTSDDISWQAVTP
jgi:Tol biopolymer transport system component